VTERAEHPAPEQTEAYWVLEQQTLCLRSYAQGQRD